MMRDAGLKPSTICINSLMSVNVQARQPGTALEIFKEMEKDGVPRDLVRDPLYALQRQLLLYAFVVMELYLVAGRDRFLPRARSASPCCPLVARTAVSHGVPSFFLLFVTSDM